MTLLSCIVTHNRLAYTKRTVESWLATVGPDARLVIVDNASTDGTQEYLRSLTGCAVLFNATNLYPGAACNRGWDFGLATGSADLLHRSDNDIEYLPGWREEVERQFADFPELALLGVLNLHEDGQPEGEGILPVPRVGGNVVMPARLFQGGLRWREGPWTPGNDEDGPMSWAAAKQGWVARLRRTVANNIAFNGFWQYPDYYRETARVRGIADAEHSV